MMRLDPRGRKKLVIMAFMGALVLSSCSSGRLRRIVSGVLDGVPDSKAGAANSPRAAMPAPPAPKAVSNPAALTPAAAAKPAPAPLESLQTWEQVSANLPLGTDGGVDWVSALHRGLVAPRLLHPPESPASAPPPTLETLINRMAAEPRGSALDLDIRIRPKSAETEAAADFYMVRFPHSSHTAWLGCSSCHPGVLAERTGMRGILAGQSCGRCHGRVSFAPEVSCGRCHPNLTPPAPDALAADIAAAAERPATVAADSIDRGADRYRAMCAVCHGASGDGKGPLSSLLDPKPRDFTAGKYKFRTTLPASIPADLDIFTTITRGVPGTSMPSFAALPRDDRWALTRYIKTLSKKFSESTPQPIPMGPPPEASPELLAMGRKLYVEAGCNLCHGDTGRGDGPSANALKDDAGHPLRPFNFASGRPLKGGPGPEAVYRALMSGYQGTPMPGFGDALTSEQGWALASYVLTFFGQAPKPFAVKGDIEFRRGQGATAASDTVSFKPATFPHWIHRVRFKCATCHPSVFEMRAGANAVSMAALRAGKFCGKCHNGAEAWEIGFKTCIKCHLGAQAQGPPPGAPRAQRESGLDPGVPSVPVPAPSGALSFAGAAWLAGRTLAGTRSSVRGAPLRPYAFDRGPVVAGGVSGLGSLLRIGSWTGENAALFEHDSHATDAKGTVGFRRNMVQGELSLRNSELNFGRLLAANVGVDLSYRSEAIKAGERSSPGTGRVVGHDVSATTRHDGRFLLGAFSSRDRTELPRLFGASRNQLTTRRGGQIRLNGAALNATVSWTRSRFESVARSEELRRHVEERGVLDYTATRRTKRQSMFVDHRREQRDYPVVPERSFPLQVTKLRYAIDLDTDASGRSLVSNVGFTRRGGRLKRDNLHTETRLDYRLRPSLDMRATGRMERVEVSSFERQRRAVDLQVRHRLYESLITTASLRSAREDLQFGARKLFGTDLLLEYRKRLVHGGRLTVSAGRRWDRENSDFDGREDVVFGEAHEARIAAPFRIEQPQVIAASIVIMDVSKATVYQEGLDYTLTVIGEFTEVSVIAAGLIEDGQNLLLDYRFRASPLTQTKTKRSHVDVSVDYGWITPYFRVHDASRTLARGFDDGSPFDQTGRAAGVRCRFGGERLRLVLSNGWQTEDAHNLDFTSWQFGQTASYAVGPRFILTANLEQNTTAFRVPSRHESRQSATGDVWWHARPGLSLRGAAAARERRDSLGFNERVYRASLDAEWKRDTVTLSLDVSRDWGARDDLGFHGMRLTSRLSRMF